MKKYFQSNLLISIFILSLECLFPARALSQFLVEGVGTSLSNPIFLQPEMGDWSSYIFLKTYYPVFMPPNYTAEHWELIKGLAENDGLLTDSIYGANCVLLKRGENCFTTVPKNASQFPTFLPAYGEDGFPYADYNRMLTVYKAPNRANFDCTTYYEHQQWRRENLLGYQPSRVLRAIQAGLRKNHMSDFIKKLPGRGQVFFDPGIRNGDALINGELCNRKGQFTPSLMFTDRIISSNCLTADCISSALWRARMRAYSGMAGNAIGSFARANIAASPEAVGAIAAGVVHGLGAPDWVAEGAGLAGASGGFGYQAYVLSGGAATGLSYRQWLIHAARTVGNSGVVRASVGPAVLGAMSAPLLRSAYDLNVNVSAALANQNRYQRIGGSQAELDLIGLNILSSNYWSGVATYHYGWISSLSPF